MKTNQLLIYIALGFLIVELSYINAKSLIYLNSATTLLHQAFSVVGSIAFSVVTILVMMNSEVKWPKYVFPVFDAGLMFLGLNLEHYNTLLDNPIRLALTVFMAAFTGIITFSLGLIEFKSLKSELARKQTEINKMESVFIKAEVSRIKKKTKNATPEELAFLEKHKDKVKEAA